MTSGPTPTSPRRSRPKWSAPAILGLAAFVAAMNARTIQTIDISGHVSPRCWGMVQSWNPESPGHRVRCNTAEPQLNLRVRELRSDGTLSPLIPASWDEQAARGAVEVLVTPNI